MDDDYCMYEKLWVARIWASSQTGEVDEKERKKSIMCYDTEYKDSSQLA